MARSPFDNFRRGNGVTSRALPLPHPFRSPSRIGAGARTRRRLKRCINFARSQARRFHVGGCRALKSATALPFRNAGGASLRDGESKRQNLEVSRRARL
eukprot:4732015-Lingulodinium_polyedra.AAC.2